MTKEELTIASIKCRISKKYNIHIENIILRYGEYNDHLGVLIKTYRFYTYIGGLKYECQNRCLTTMIKNIEEGLFKEEIREEKLNNLLK